jgi:adenylosuccinate synthase
MTGVGLLSTSTTALIGSGVVVHLPSLFHEMDTLTAKGLSCDGRLFISDRAHIVFDLHRLVDGLKEVELGGGKIGTTKQGIGPTYSNKASRSGLRVHHLFEQDFEVKFRRLVDSRVKRYGPFEYDVDKELMQVKEYAERLKPLVVDGVTFIHNALKGGKKILVEGANALLLDIDFGTYPYVTSSNTSIGGVCTGLAIPPARIGKTIGVVKAYTTRVGGGPFPTELTDATGEHLQNVGHEYGTTTGRKRRCGWLDTVVLDYSNKVNGYTTLNVTKLDVLDDLDEIWIGTAYVVDGVVLDSFPADLHVLEKVQVTYTRMPGWKQDITACRTWDALPLAAQNYIRTIEQLLQLPVEWIGVGPSRDAMIHLAH